MKTLSALKSIQTPHTASCHNQASVHLKNGEAGKTRGSAVYEGTAAGRTIRDTHFFQIFFGSILALAVRHSEMR
jgi:hypothetical protein